MKKKVVKKRKQSKGFGDTIEKITEGIGIKAVVKTLFGDGCGCDERKEKLNKLFPYRRPNCLEEHEFNYLDDMFKCGKTRWNIEEQKEVLKIYNRVLNDAQQPTGCDSCWITIIQNLETVYREWVTKN